MEIFRGRPLAAAGALTVLLAAGALYFRGALYYGIAAGTAAVLLAVLAAACVKRKITAYRALSSAAVLCMLLLFLLRAGTFYLGTYGAALRYAGAWQQAELRVTSRESLSAYSSCYGAEVLSVNGERCRFGAELRCDFSSDFAVGERLLAENAVLSDAAEDYAGNPADGILLTVAVSEPEAIGVLGTETPSRAEEALSRLRARLSTRLARAVGGEEGGLCAAMVFGRTADVSVRRDFRRSGVSHLLAVSGMHLSAAAMLLDGLLFRLRVKKGGRMLLVSLGILLYLGVLGFPFSALRSACMLWLSYAGLLLGADGDGLSSLGLSLAVILIWQPAAVADSGFILTASSTFGIVSLLPLFRGFAARIGEKLRAVPLSAGRGGRAVGAVLDGAAKLAEALLPALGSMTAANLMTAVPVAVLFGEISLFSPVSNLIFPPLAEGTVVLSFLTLLFPDGSFLSGMAAYYAGKTAGLQLWLSRGISEIRGVCFSLRFRFCLPVLLFGAVGTVLLLTVRLRKKRRVLLPAALSLCAMILCSVLCIPRDVHLFVTSRNGSEVCAAVSSGSAVLTDFSAGGYRSLAEAAQKAKEAGGTEFEALILTHYHVAHVGAAERFLRTEKVRRVWMPRPENAKDASVMLRVCETAAELGAECAVYAPGEELTVFGDAVLTLSGPERIRRSTHPVLSMTLRTAKTSFCYLGASVWEGARTLPTRNEGTCYTVFGTHGPILKTSPAVRADLLPRADIFDLSVLPYIVSDPPSACAGKIFLHKETAYFRLKRG